jgi:hypothetical protein
MAALRIVLILLLSVTGDFTLPLQLEAMESVEESEAALHRQRGRRSLRLVRAVFVPSPERQGQPTSLRSPARLSGKPAARRAIGGGMQKVPAPVPDSAPVSEDD